MEPWPFEIEIVNRHQQIAERAYFSWLNQGKPHNSALNHWLSAREFYLQTPTNDEPTETEEESHQDTSGVAS
jgi:hypothetical protein